MLLGTTFAWFTDTASTAVNKIQAGNLKLELSYKNAANGVFTKVSKETPVFDKDALWEPGHVEYVVLNVKNAGSLALKYKLGIHIAAEMGSTNVEGDAFLLSDYIKFAVIDGEADTTDRAVLLSAAEAAGSKLISAGYTKENHLDRTGDSETVTLVLWMPETVGNKANHAVDAQAPAISLGINAFATQYTYESDSFDNTYDEDAPYTTVKVSDEKELRTALSDAPTDGSGVKIVLQDDITLEMLYAADNFGTEIIADNEAGDTLNRYKTGVHPTAEDPTHWNPLVVNQTLEERAAYGAYYNTGAGDERIARLVVKAGQDVILDLNGNNLAKADRVTHGDWTLTCTNLIGNYGTLSVIDSEGTGLITGSGLISCSGGVIQNFGGELTVGNVNIDGGAQGGGGQYTVVNGAQETPGSCMAGKIVLDGTHIFDDATSASLICNMEGALVLKGGADLRHVNTKVINVKGGSVEIEDATVKSDVYAIYIVSGTVTIHALTVRGTGTIQNNGGTLTDYR